MPLFCPSLLSAIDLFTNRPEGAIPGLVAQSFSKNCGLYGQRVGCLHVLCSSDEQQAAIFSQLKALSRVEISTPPAFGGRIVRCPPSWSTPPSSTWLSR